MADDKRSALGKKIDFEIAKARHFWFETAKKRGWDDDIRDHGWKMLERSLRASRMREAKVRKHDAARTLFGEA